VDVLKNTAFPRNFGLIRTNTTGIPPNRMTKAATDIQLAALFIGKSTAVIACGGDSRALRARPACGMRDAAQISGRIGG
jgi:hypothetical protein